MCMLLEMNGFYFHVLDLPQRCSFPSHLRTKTEISAVMSHEYPITNLTST